MVRRGGASDEAVVAALLGELRLPHSVLSLLVAHASAVEAQASRLGLIGPGDVGRTLVRHTADALLFALVKEPQPHEVWADVGSGAGFPGLVLACCYPDTRFVLIEPLRRRAGFLELQGARLGLENARITARRAQEVTDRFDVAVARALADPAQAFATLSRVLRPGGWAIVATGPAVAVPKGVEEGWVRRPGVESPGRFLIARVEIER